ncbi:MAG: glycosyltransferase [Deltaproteobacteria bacterium]|nr:glycosyltransferase [Deltaproteobacteria bacterium]
MDKLKFCLVTNWYPPDNFAGSGIYLYHLAHALVEQGHEVTVVYCRESFQIRSKGRSQKDMPQDSRIKIIRVESPFGALAPLAVHQTGRPLFNAPRLKEILNEDFDVINYNNISLMGGPKVYQYGKAVKIATLHDYWLLCPISSLFKFKKNVCRKKSCFLCSIYSGKPPQLWRYTSLLKKSLSHIDAFISPSKFLKSLHIKQGVGGPFFHIPYLIKPMVSENEENEERPYDKPYFLFAGRLERIKGVQEIIPAFKHGEFGPLLIVGDGSYRNELEKLSNGSKHVVFLGYVNQKELMRYYRGALAVIVPSIWYDNYPLVICDALSTGVPIIARDIAGPAELVRESGAGTLFRTENELKTAMEEMADNAELRSTCSKRGKAFFNDNFRVEVHLSRLFSAIRQTRELKRA